MAMFFAIDKDRKIQQRIYDKAVKIYEVITNDNTKDSI
jgi:hypothetical protein